MRNVHYLHEITIFLINLFSKHRNLIFLIFEQKLFFFDIWKMVGLLGSENNLIDPDAGQCYECKDQCRVYKKTQLFYYCQECFY